MSKLFKYEFFVSLFFVVLLTLPFLFSFANRNVSISAAEKRELAAFPDVSFSLSKMHTFPKKFEAYYEDHFGFRNSIVRAHNYALCKIFGVSPNQMVVVGSKGWYFFNSEGAISDYLGRVQYNKTQLEQIKYTLQNRSEWLHSLGIQYLYLPVPNKEAIYDEYLPLIIQKNKGYDSYSQIVDYLKNNSSFTDFIDTKEILVQKRNDLQLFFRTDSHWNHDGSSLIYRSIVSRLQRWFPDITPLQEKDRKQWHYKFSGDLAILMNLSGLVTETAPALNIIEECDPGALQPWNRIIELPGYSHLPAHRIPVTNGCKERKIKAIVIHDSFGSFLRPYLSQHFSSVIYINSMNFEGAKTIIEQERPDIVLDLRVAREILRSVLPDQELEQRLLAKKFAEMDLVFTTIDQSNWKEFRYKSRGTTIRKTTAGVNLSFSERTSSVHLRLDHASQPATPLVVRIEGTNKDIPVMSFCSHHRGKRGELLRQFCEKRDLDEGSNLIFLRIYNPQPEQILELAPDSAGSFTLNALQVKQETVSRGDSSELTGSSSF